MSAKIALSDLLCTEDRRRIWRALRLGREIHITPEQRAVCRETGEDFGCQIAAQVILFAGFARWRRGCAWVMEVNTKRSNPHPKRRKPARNKAFPRYAIPPDTGKVTGSIPVAPTTEIP